MVHSLMSLAAQRRWWHWSGPVAAVYAYRKQRVDEAAGRRADDEGLGKRYQDAAEQLGHEKEAVRLAGVYSMARLADDWPEQRQTCIDVLCASIRMPILKREDGLNSDADPVRAAIAKLIFTHLAPTVLANWCDMDLDLSGA